jgi:hypothetical protein
VDYEVNHLKHKLKKRDKMRFVEFESLTNHNTHKQFKIIEGDIEVWEII